MSLFFLINSLAGGGAEAVLLRIKDHIRPKQIFLIERDIRYEINNSEIGFLSGHKNKTSPILKTIYIPFYAFKLQRKLTKEDVVISFLERANYVNIIAKLFSKHKAVISVHMDVIAGHRGLRVLNKLLIKLLYPKADLIITVSYGIKSGLVSNFGIEEKRINVIYNPFPIEEIKNKAKEHLGEYEFIKKYQSLITVGRLTYQKGQWYLIRVFREIKKEFNNLKLLILGEGELKSYLVSLSEELGLKTYVWDRNKLSEDYDVYFLGFQKNPFKFITSSTIFVFPSLWEGFGNVLIEALACSVSVISADCRSGPREILAPNTDPAYETKESEFAQYGVLLPVFEEKYKKANEPLSEREKIWIDTIKKLLINEELRKEYVFKSEKRAWDFDVDKIVREWEKIVNIKNDNFVGRNNG